MRSEREEVEALRSLLYQENTCYESRNFVKNSSSLEEAYEVVDNEDWLLALADMISLPLPQQRGREYALSLLLDAPVWTPDGVRKSQELWKNLPGRHTLSTVIEALQDPEIPWGRVNMAYWEEFPYDRSFPTKDVDVKPFNLKVGNSALYTVLYQTSYQVTYTSWGNLRDLNAASWEIYTNTSSHSSWRFEHWGSTYSATTLPHFMSATKRLIPADELLPAVRTFLEEEGFYE